MPESALLDPRLNQLPVRIEGTWLEEKIAQLHRERDMNIAALIELFDIPYTGATSTSLFLCNDKGLCKKILRFHRVRVPRFHTY